MRRRVTMLATILAIMMVAGVAQAAPSFEKFDEKDGWICGSAEGLVDNHCLNIKSEGTVKNIKVFLPDPRGPQEGLSFDPKFDDRPCPHDEGSPDGTWWEFAPGMWVCHHSGTQG